MGRPSRLADRPCGDLVGKRRLRNFMHNLAERAAQAHGSSGSTDEKRVTRHKSRLLTYYELHLAPHCLSSIVHGVGPAVHPKDGPGLTTRAR